MTRSVGPGPRRRGSRQRRCMLKDLTLELAHSGPGFQAEISREVLVQVAIDLEGLDVPAGAVQRQHEELGHALARGMLDPKRIERPDDFRMAPDREAVLRT